MALTAKQEKFAQSLADGMTQADAYRAAYKTDGWKPESVWSKASELVADVKVLARVTELKAALEDKQLWTREQSVNVLVEIAHDSESRANEKVAAVKELNSMHGFNAPTKLDIDMSFPRIINVISGRA